jgi:hypothetical protein
MRKLLSTLVLIAFVANTTLPAAYAQEIFLPAPGAMVHLSPSFNPPILKGIKVYPENPFLLISFSTTAKVLRLAITRKLVNSSNISSLH